MYEKLTGAVESGFLNNVNILHNRVENISSRSTGNPRSDWLHGNHSSRIQVLFRPLFLSD